MLHASSLQFLGPAGRWTLFRLGCSVLPVHLHPAKRARPVSCENTEHAQDRYRNRYYRRNRYRTHASLCSFKISDLGPDTIYGEYRSSRAGSLAGRLEKLAPRGQGEVPRIIAHDYGRAQFWRLVWTTGHSIWCTQSIFPDPSHRHHPHPSHVPHLWRHLIPCLRAGDACSGDTRTRWQRLLAAGLVAGLVSWSASSHFSSAARCPQ